LETPFWSYTKEKILSSLQTGEDGISENKAELLLAEKQPKKKTKSLFLRDIILFFNQFTSPLVLLLVAAVILSAFLGETSDVFIILFILIATGSLSFWQERNAGRAVEKLQSLIQLTCTVIREGKTKEIPSHQIVNGDLLVFKSGDIVPADCFLIELNELNVNEASLTGESFPVRKVLDISEEAAALTKRKNCLWQGSNVISGTAKAIVVNTGEDTIFGSIAKSISVSNETAFEKGIRQFGYFLMKITIVLSILILVLNLLFHHPLINSVLFALALAIGMAPELLPAIMTIAMSAGAKRMLEKKVIVKKLSSIQNLGEINLLCTDKTGTITEGIIKIVGTPDAKGTESEFVKKLSYLNASFETGFSNPIDDAIKQQKQDISGYSKLGEIPYDFIRKRLSIAVNDGKQKIFITKGSVKNVLEVCTLLRNENGETINIQDQTAALQQKFIDYSNEGFRVIAVCYKTISGDTITIDNEHEMIFAGFVLMEDPLKQGIEDAIKEFATLGISVKIITGDNRFVAAHVGKKLGINADRILTGPEIQKMTPEALVAKAKETELFAEIEPQQKETIIRALQSGGFTIAYMGDGINDVAAINAADAGISISNAVDVAREAADFVLLEKDLSVLAAGVREGRRTFSNTLKYIFINTGATFGNMFSVAIASLMLPFLPMLPTQILLTNFLTDIPYMAISSDNVDDEQLEKPGKWNLKQIRNFMIVFGIHSSFFDVITFITLYKILKVNEGTFQTGWFLESILTELFILFIIRTHKPFLKSIPGKQLVWLSALSFALTFVLIYMPFGSSLGLFALGFKILLAISTIILAYVITADILKGIFFKWSKE
jgi:Mg2+-importing ATPase